MGPGLGMMTIDTQTLDERIARAKESPRRRMYLDLRHSQEDGSLRMLYAIGVGSAPPIHRHMKSPETVLKLRGSLREIFHDDAVDGACVDVGCAPCAPLNIPLGQWHTVEPLASSTVIPSARTGPANRWGGGSL